VIDPESYYFRINPLFEAAATRYDWLNRIVAVGIGHRRADGLIYSVFELCSRRGRAVDDGVGLLGSSLAGLYVNGVQTTQSVNAEGNAFRWETVFNIPAQYTFAGSHLIALQLKDHGRLTGFDMDGGRTVGGSFHSAVYD